MKQILFPAVALVLTLVLAGCGNTTGARVSSGTAIGAATGAIIGSFGADAGAGALIGAGVGALGGRLVDEHAKGHFD
ncbi:hypothetical protein MARPU_12560 [Marichromatium purpuratum 984]|uniref:Glycine zipper domain-containing protein n=1 Tax=Marichromatium purpuratum 984 TaxID=765910 RepID=W0E121_MARPU|nr:glycine zipper domain-containing protein [Marichromatium purpuratum]AHF04580.1 hypothetical protein MARPU_12560 [Marichromatium purpuratum 984]